jgi:phage gpG-like protein
MRGHPVEGVDELNRLLDRIPVDAERIVKRNVKRSAVNIEAGAKRRCKVRTGRTRNGISHRVDDDGMDAAVGVNVEYAVHQHFGTGARGQASAAEFGFSGGAYDTSFQGQPANPFLYLAAEEERPKFVSRLSADLEKELAKLAGGG